MMREIWFAFLIVIFGAGLMACRSPETPVCRDDQVLIDGQCVDIECDTDETLIDGACVPIECDTDETLIDGECVLIVLTPLEKAILDGRSLKNYRLDISINLDYTQVTMSLLFTEFVLAYDIAGVMSYFEIDGDQCYEYTETETGFDKVNVSCEPEGDHYGFYLDFEADWFEFTADSYRLIPEHLDVINDFFNQDIPGAVASNFYLTLEDDCFKQMTFDLTVGEDLYQFDMHFSEYHDVTITLPTTD